MPTVLYFVTVGILVTLTDGGKTNKAAFARQTKVGWQTSVGKLKLICVKGTKTVGKRVGKLLATNRTCLYSRQLFCVGKLESDV